MPASNDSPRSPVPFLAGGGEMGERMRSFDWRNHPMGEPAHWPSPIKAAIGILLNSRFPMAVWVGPELFNFYNDSYIPLMGLRHPIGFGVPAATLWKEIWPIVGPQADAVMTQGLATWNERVYLSLERNGYPEDTWFTWSYSPLPDENGHITGMLCVCTEDTPRVMAERERDRFAEKARAAYNLLDSVAESSQDPIAAIDHNYRFTIVNSAYRREFERVYGGKLEVGDSALEALSPYPDDLARAKEFWRRALAGEMISTTAEFGDPERARRTFMLSFYPVRDAQGRIIGAGQICTDITARRTAEQEAKVILESVTDAYLSIDTQWRFTYMNPQAERLLNFTIDDIGGKTIWEVYPGLIGSPFETAYRNTVKNRVPQSVTSYYPDHDRWYEVHSYPSATGISVYFRDVTTARRAEIALRGTEERFRLAADAVNGIIYEWDLRTNYIERTRGLYEVLGYRPEEVPPTADWWRDQVHPDDLAGERQVHDTKITPDGTTIAHYRVRHKDGRWLHVEDRSVVMRDASGQPIKTIGCTLDVTERMRTTADLQASERRFRFLSELSEMTRSATTPEQVMQIVSQALGEYLGASRCAYAEVNPDSNRFTIIHAYTRDCPTSQGSYRLENFGSRAVEELRSGRTLVIRNVDLELTDADGGETFREFGLQAIVCCPRVHGGRLLSMMAVEQTTPRDWTEDEIRLIEVVVERCWAYIERARAEAQVRESEARFREFADSAPAMLWITEADGKCSFVSRGWYEYTGLKPDQGLEYGWIDAVHPDEQAYIRQEFLTANARREPYLGEYRLRLANGKYAWVIDAGRPRFDADGQFLGYIGSIIDIDERIRAEEALRQSRERLDMVVSSSQIGLWYCDLPFGVLDWNAKVKEHFGLPADAVVTIDTFFERLHPDDHERTRLAVEKSIRERSEYDIEFRTIGLDGQERWIRALGRATYDAQGTATAFDGITIDVTQRVLQAQALHDADRRKDEFLATLAHELRNPLAPLRHGLELMELAGDDPETVAEARGIMQRQLMQMVRLIDDLLDLSRISRGKVELRRETVDLSQVVHSAVETCEQLIRRGKHQLTLNLPSEPVLLNADFTRLSQVFANLLNNSARYSEPGGKIDVTATRCDDHVKVVVQDAGLGIPPEMIPRVFEMFTQVDRSLEKQRGGLGIGLTLVQRFVELHGGTVTAESEGVGRGSRFTVMLPLSPVEELLPEPPQTPEPAVGGRKILVVDDNRDAAVSLSRMLQLMGHETRVAHDGQEALEIADGYRPDVVLLDIGMPKLNGYDTATRLRQRSWGPNVALIALTGWGQDEDRRRSLEAGFDAHLVKPIDRQTLEAVMRRVARVAATTD